jgi:hypothetical protein
MTSAITRALDGVRQNADGPESQPVRKSAIQRV